MKKLLWGFLFLILPLTVWASPINKTVLTTTLDDDPINATSTVVYIADWTNPTIYVLYDEPTSTAASVAFSLDFSVDGTNWLDGRFFDLAGGTTLQTSENFTTDDTNYIAWLNNSVNYPFIRISATGSGTDATNTATMVIYIVGQK